MLNIKRILIILFGALFLAAAIGILFFFIYLQIQKTGKIISDAESKILTIEKEERALSKTSAELEKLKDEITNIEGTFLTETNFVEFIKLLEHISRKTGNVFRAESAEMPRGGQSSQAFSNNAASITFALDGSFASIHNFLTLIDKIPTAGIVENMTISTAGKFLSARIKLTILNFKF